MRATQLAAAQVWAFVSGLPRSEARKRQIMALQAFVDGSGGGEPDVLVLAGYVADAAVWAEFSEEWKTQLDHAGMAAFKMSEMVNRPEVAAYFYRIIERHNVLVDVSVAFNTAFLRKAIKEIIPPEIEKLESGIGNPYYWAFRSMIEGVAAVQDQLDLNEPIDFIFDDQSEKSRIFTVWDAVKNTMRPDVRARVGSDPIFREDHKFMPLQAADLLAWWARKWHREGRGGTRVPFAWERKRQLDSLNIEIYEPSIRASLKRIVAQHSVAKLRGVTMTLPDPTSILSWKK
jgi:hypothetical protein